MWMRGARMLCEISTLRRRQAGKLQRTRGMPRPDTILLDRQPPTAKAVIGAGTIAVGSAISLSGSTSVDGISDPTKDSGIDPTSYQWQFGDGTIAAGAAVTKTYSAAGTFVGTLTVKDIAGNSNTANFQVVVPALPTGASTGGTTPGGTTGGSTTGGTPRVKKFAFGKILAGGLRFGKAGTVSLTVNKKTTVKVVLRRAGKSKVVRSVSRTGGPGVVKVTFVAPAAGSYTLVATASGTSKTIKVVVKP